MATVMNRTIGLPANGRDFATIAAWRDHADADDLVGDDTIYSGHFYPEGLGTDGEWTERITLSGMGTDATHYVELRPAAGEGFADKQVRGVDSRKYDPTKGVAWNAPAFYGQGPLNIQNNYVYVRGLQITCNGNAPAIAVDASTPHSYIIGNILQQTGSVAPLIKRGNGGAILNNYIIAAGTQSIGLDTRIVGSIPIKFNLIVRPSDSGSVGTGDAISAHGTFTPVVTGNVALGFGRFSENASADAASDYNQCDTTSNLLGSNSVGTRTYAGNYAGHTAAGQDWFLIDSPEIEGAGPTSDSDVTDDVHGTARPQSTNYEPGPEELVAAVGGTITTSLDAAVQRQVTIAASLSAAIRETRTASASLDSAIRLARTVTTALDGALRQARSATTQLDAAVRQDHSISAGLDGAIRRTETATTALDAFVQAGFEVTTSLDAAIRAARTASASLDATVMVPGDVTASVDAAISEARTVSASLDGAIRAALSLTASVDAAIRLTRSAQSSLDAVISTTLAIASVLDAAIRATITAFAYLDAVIEDPDAVPPVGRSFTVPGRQAFSVGARDGFIVPAHGGFTVH